MRNKTLYTIGYEGACPGDFWATLVAARVQILIDIRDKPFSRKSGFSKRALEEDAAAHDIGYVHLSGLGDPKEGREAAKARNYELFTRIFESHMKTPQAQSDLKQAMTLSTEGTSCLLCYERKPQHCHRMIVAKHMMWYEEFRVCHLGVQAGIVRKCLPSSATYEDRNLDIGHF